MKRLTVVTRCLEFAQKTISAATQYEISLNFLMADDMWGDLDAPSLVNLFHPCLTNSLLCNLQLVQKEHIYILKIFYIIII